MKQQKLVAALVAALALTLSATALDASLCIRDPIRPCTSDHSGA